VTRVAARGQRGSASCLLVFPPLSPLHTHPELCLGQLVAYLRRAGVPVRALDLNVELLHRHLREQDVLARLLGTLGPVEAHLAQALPAHLAGRAATLARAIHLEAGAPLPRDTLAAFLRRFLEQQESAAPRPGPATFDAAPARSPEALARRLLGMEPLRWLVSVRLAGLLTDAAPPPAGFTPEAVLARLAAAEPFLDAFLERSLDPWLDEAPGVVALSLHGSSQLLPALRIAARARRLAPRARILMGGPWCRAAREVLRESPALLALVDGLATGEGELALVAACRAAGRGADLARAPGMLRAHQGRVLESRERAPIPLERLPAPAFDDLPLGLYPERKLPFRTLRGCPWGRCRFCYHLDADDQDARARRGRGMSPRLLALLGQTVLDARRLGVEHLTLADNATPARHLGQVADALRARGLEVRWEALARFEAGFTPALLSRLARSGCQDLFFGLETCDPAGWRHLRKGLRMEVVLRGLEACAAAGVRANVFLLHYPGQGREGYARSLEWVCAHSALIANAIPQRFALGRASPAFARPQWFGIRPAPAASRSLAIHELPFRAEGFLSAEEFQRVTEHAAVRFLARKIAAAAPDPGRRPA